MNDTSPHTVLCHHLQNHINENHLQLSIEFDSLGPNITSIEVKLNGPTNHKEWIQIQQQLGTLFITPDEIKFRRPVKVHRSYSWEDPRLIQKLESLLNQMNKKLNKILNQP